MNKIISLLLLSLIASSTVFASSTESILIASAPSAATVIINGQESGKTPLQLNLNTAQTYTIHIAKEGYALSQINLKASLKNGWLYAIAPGGALLYLFNHLRGSTHTFDKKEIIIELHKSPIRHHAHGHILQSTD